MPPATVTIASGSTWQEVAADRQAYRDASIARLTPALPDIPSIPLNAIPLAKQILTAAEVKITETTVEELVPKLASGELKATDVVKAFLRRAGVAQRATNCVTELLPERALQRAAFLDTYLSEHGKPMGPLHGLPISVKEHLGMKDCDLNGGFVAWVGKVSKEDAHLLQILWAAGAVFYVRTTQPQSLMHLETSSNLYGVTTNPFNTTLTSGGSSGGEGALIGFRGSILGIGSDIGGSIRSPAANNGVYGFKPTTMRLPSFGMIATMFGSEQILPTFGPLSTSLEGCKLFMKTVIDSKPWLKEPSLLPFPWKDDDAYKGRKPKIAVLWDDGVVRPHPPVTRALRQVIENLKAKDNVEIVEWIPYKHDEAWAIIANLYFCDGGEEDFVVFREADEPELPLTTHILRNEHVQAHTISSMWQAVQRRDAYRMAYAHHWNSTATSTGPRGELHGMVDAILCPAGPGAAPKLDTSRWWGYTSQWNLLDVPAVVFPVDRVDPAQHSAAEKYTPRNEKDRYNWDLWELHGAEGYRNAPVSLQLVGRRYEDEKLIQTLEIVKAEAGLPFVDYL